ncbi:MAG: hypothetical protein DMG65_09465 [Candidatus Angelobacter sp. Gp1-AA117]|nr:MAG: hypothetical protein DMG65_09465 [Candidatus Angelobacter sp. Gp1-AA117]
MRSANRIFLVLLVLVTLASARRRDPLNDAETDQLREVAMEPYKRLKLYIKFAEVRLVAIDQMRTDPKMSPGRGQRIHDLLEDFTAILDEINDNVDQYEGRPLSKDDRKDFKKGLKEVIEADGKFELKLRTLKSATETDPQMKKEASDFQFVLQDAMEALKSNADMAREYMADKESDNTGTTKKK